MPTFRTPRAVGDASRARDARVPTAAGWPAVLTAIVSAVALLAGQAVPPTRAVPPPSAHAAPGVTYADVTSAAGLSSFRHMSGGAEKRYIIDVTGSGVATWDFDNDGRVDIYLLNGSTLDQLRTGTASPRAALYRNQGDGTFTDVTATVGLANERWGQGVCVGDIDNDGFEDVYVTNFGKNRLYRHTARGTFEDVAEAARVAVDSWSTGCAFGDYDHDGLLDLFVAGYVALDITNLPPAADDGGGPIATSAPAESSSPQAGAAGAPQTGVVGMGASYSAGTAGCRYRGERVICGPRGLTGAADHLFHNNGDGTFTDVSAQAGVADTDTRYGFGVAWVDLDDDGWIDLVVANDSGPNSVYRNRGNGTFEDISYRSGAALDGNGRTQAHMGLAVGDYDNDGRDDLHITNFADDFNVLYHNDGALSFSDVSDRTGLTEITLPFLGWGTNFLDYDNDGWLDLLVVNGHVYPQADRLDWHSSYAQRALLFRNRGGRRFEEIGAAAGTALTTPRSSRGSATADFDNDGGLDIVINTLDGPPVLARNVSTSAGAASAGDAGIASAASGSGADTSGSRSGGNARHARAPSATAIQSAPGTYRATEAGASTVGSAGSRAGGAATAGGRGHWLTLQLRGDPARKCPRDAIGSVVFVTAGGRRVRGEVASGRGQMSQSDLRVHVGLGEATRVTTVEVRWANGATAQYAVDRVDAVVVIDQASGAVTFPTLRPPSR